MSLFTSSSSLLPPHLFQFSEEPILTTPLFSSYIPIYFIKVIRLNRYLDTHTHLSSVLGAALVSTLADPTTHTAGFDQNEAVAAHKTRSEAASNQISTEPLSDLHLKGEAMRPTEDTPPVGVKEEPESPRRFTMGLLSETPEPATHSVCAYARKAFSEHTTESLELMAIYAKESLKRLEGPLKKVVGSSSDARRTLDNIKEIQKRKLRVRSHIGIVGGTGAGKSSLINAMLGKECLLPTYDGKACTAAVTEVSWNDSEESDELYRAEVELITKDEWLKELHDLIEDIKSPASGDGDDSEDDSEKTEAHISWAKIQSVYPHLDKETLLQRDASSLFCNETLLGILSTAKKFKADSALGLYEQIRPYMDSSDNSREGTSTEGEQPAALWPLTKVVKVFTKADILSTGVILVDLPGCGDSNVARGAVAAKYMEQCTSIFVVAPIVRAVDDKLAQHLLGESFKLQMKLDGHYAKMTFICSRTDSLNVKEMAKRLGLGDDLAEYEATKTKTDDIIASEGTEHKKLKDDISYQKTEKQRLEKRITQYQKLEVAAAQGKPVFAPAPNDRKRKSTTDQNQPAKKQRGSTGACPSPIDSDSDSDEDEDDNDGHETNDIGTAKILTLDDIQSTLRELQREKDVISKDIKTKKHRCQALNRNKVSLKKDVEEKRVNLRSKCIKRRNSICRSDIKRDFIRGRKELDQKTGAQARSCGYEGEKPSHDHESIGDRLRVFCVSSLQYQIKKGWSTEDGDDGFVTADDTEIPELLKHTKESAGDGSAANCKNTVSSSLHVLESLHSWATPKDNEDNLSDESMMEEEENLNQASENVAKEVAKITTGSIGECKNSLKRNLFNQFTKALMAVFDAPPGTYKATLRRFGKNDRKGIDFNEVRLKESTADAWEKTFQSQIPEILDKFCGDIENKLMLFHDAVRLRLEGTAAETRVNLLEGQVRAYHIQGIKDLVDIFRSKIEKKQREASRTWTPKVQEAMRSTYEKCLKHKGRGAINKMRKVMNTKIVENGKRMYTAVTKQVKDSLTEMIDEFAKEIEPMVDNTIESMTSDYRSCITRRDEPVAPREVRREILRIISNTDEEFRRRYISAPGKHVPEATASMDIDTNSHVNCAAATALDGTSVSAYHTEVKGEPASSQNEQTNNSQKSEDNGSGPVDQTLLLLLATVSSGNSLLAQLSRSGLHHLRAALYNIYT
ncbi:Nuclear GTPase SLIP-GC [Apiospora saccharicola]|uniref:Nuclear GTPase SLIP-GC n=1 Tax=Apiospora saccharicola TaxID=335842 RepID=A0ABR1WIW6_9PEZI